MLWWHFLVLTYVLFVRGASVYCFVDAMTEWCDILANFL